MSGFVRTQKRMQFMTRHLFVFTITACGKRVCASHHVAMHVAMHACAKTPYASFFLQCNKLHPPANLYWIQKVRWAHW